MKKVLITGSRRWTDVKAVQDAILAERPDIIIHGSADGADLIAQMLARKHQINYRGYPAKWTKHGKAAGPIRNTEMLTEEHHFMSPINVCLAFPKPDSIGTIDMIEKCEKAGIPVIRITDKKPFHEGNN